MGNGATRSSIARASSRDVKVGVAFEDMKLDLKNKFQIQRLSMHKIYHNFYKKKYFNPITFNLITLIL